MDPEIFELIIWDNFFEVPKNDYYLALHILRCDLVCMLGPRPRVGAPPGQMFLQIGPKFSFSKTISQRARKFKKVHAKKTREIYCQKMFFVKLHFLRF